MSLPQKLCKSGQEAAERLDRSLIRISHYANQAIDSDLEMTHLWRQRADRRKAKRRHAIRTLSTPAVVRRLVAGEFEVLCRIDAYADYVAIVEAGDAAEAAELANDFHDAYHWEAQGVDEFDDRFYVTLDASGTEIAGTEVGDR